MHLKYFLYNNQVVCSEQGYHFHNVCLRDEQKFIHAFYFCQKIGNYYKK